MVYASEFHTIPYKFVYTEFRIPSNVVCAELFLKKHFKKLTPWS
jgi:hypothetical protein